MMSNFLLLGRQKYLILRPPTAADNLSNYATARCGLSFTLCVAVKDRKRVIIDSSLVNYIHSEAFFHIRNVA